VDASGNAVPGTVLHHVAFWNENRAGFFSAQTRKKHIFGAGGEMTDWAEIPGYGYRVQGGEKISIETMVHNPTETSYDKAFLEVVIPFQETPGEASAAAPRKGVYPAWMDVRSCRDSSYDLPAGKSEQIGSATVKYEGVCSAWADICMTTESRLCCGTCRATKPWPRSMPRPMLKDISSPLPVKLLSRKAATNLGAATF